MNGPKNCPLGGYCCPGGQCAWAYDGGCAIVSIAQNLECVARGGITVEMEGLTND